MSDGTVRMRKPKLGGKPANDATDAEQVAAELGFTLNDVYVTEMRDEPPSEEDMVDLRDEIAKFGLGLLQKIEAGDLTHNQARYQVIVRVSLMDCGYETTADQRDELYRVGFRSAGVLKEQLQQKRASGF